MSAAHTLNWQANLLDDSLRAALRPQRSRTIKWALLGGLILAALISLGQAQRAHMQDLRARAEAAEARLRQTRLEAGPEAQARVTARRQLATAVEYELADKRALADALREVFAALDPDWTASEVMRALSERHLDGLWLDRIRVDRMRRELALEGYAPRAAEVSTYVGHLGGEGSLLARMQASSVVTERDVTRPGASAPAAPESGEPGPLRFRIALRGMSTPPPSDTGGGR